MPLPAKYAPIDIKPLTGYFDVRSPPDLVRPGTWRYRQNVQVTESNKLCRRQGWSKLFDKPPGQYNNEDLHDQLVNLQQYYEDYDPPKTGHDTIALYPPDPDVCKLGKLVRGTGRQPITFLFAATATTGDRKVLAGTQTRIYALNESKGNWKLLADAYGGDPILKGVPERRWSAAMAGNSVIFTNGFDPPLSWDFDAGTRGCNMQAVSPIESLTTVGVNRANVVWSWKGYFFLGDIEEDGHRRTEKLIWSDFQSTNFAPTTATKRTDIPGFQPLTSGERILAAKPLGDSCLIYTNKGIWEMTFVGTVGAEGTEGEGQAFAFRNVYSEPENGAACLAYRFTLVSTGQEHLYAARDGIYRFNLFMPQPERVEWMHVATGDLFETIDDTRCDSHVGWFDPSTKEYWISWIEKDEFIPTLPVRLPRGFPYRTLVFNTRYQSDDVVDHGFTAFCSYVPDLRPNVLQWMLDNLVCLRSELATISDIITPVVKEGDICVGPPPNDCTSSHEEALTTDAHEPPADTILTQEESEDLLTGSDGTELLVVSGEQPAYVPCRTPGSDADVLTTNPDEVLTTQVDNADLPVCGDRNLPLYTDKVREFEGMLIEDYDAAPTEDSLCSHLEAGDDLNDVCRDCDPPGVLIMASAKDWCLKQNGGVYYREQCSNCAPCISDEDYVKEPYRTVLRSGAIDGGLPREDKHSRSLELEFLAGQHLDQEVPSVVEMSIGASTQAVDPNHSRDPHRQKACCPLIWHDLQPRNLVCQSQLQSDKRPNRPLSWVFLYTARYFYLEMAVDGLGGDICFSRLSMEIRQRPRSITMR